MKKSQLRKIIRESIKGLMTEQANVYTYSGYSTGGTFSGNQEWTLGGSPQAFYQAVGSPQPGEFIGVEHSYTGGYWGNGTYICIRYNGMNTSAMQVASENYNLDLSTVNITNSNQACYAAASTSTGTSGCTDSTANNYNSNATVDDGSCDYSYNCMPSLGTGQQFACSPASAGNPGTYPTLSACQSANPNLPGGCSTPPVIQIKKSQPDDKISRMQDLANIR